jgi:subtilase family serine protease
MIRRVMIRRVSCLLLSLAAMLAMLGVASQAQVQPLLTSHTIPAVVNGEVQTLGRMPATQTLHFDVVLALRHAPELQNFLKDIYDPTSPNYRHFVTLKQFSEQFGPSQEDYDALIQFAKASGFTVTGGSRDAMDVRFSAPVGAVEKAFHVQMNVYQHPTENRTFHAPDREPTVDLSFQPWHISGLDDFTLPRTTLLRPQGNVRHATTGSGPGGGFLGSDMRAAYYGNGPMTGAGQSIGLLEYVGTDLADLNTYYKNVGQTLNTPITLVSVDGTSVNCTASQGCDDTEQTIDMTQALGMAPNTSSLVMFIGSTDTALLSGMSSYNPLPQQLSASWIWQTSPAADDPFFQKMAAQGQNYFNASGDDAEFNSGYPTWPCDSDYVTSVGGTDLVTQGAGGPWSSETGWADSGGGFWQPDNIPFPSWQAGIVNQSNKASSTYRNAPDIAAEANFDFYYCADQSGCSTGLGGTSFAAPMWAGYLALANQQGEANGNPPLGFINPAIYALGLGSNYSTYFHDIVSGSNGLPAVAGYDLVTGWGSPIGANLVNYFGGPLGPSFTLATNPSSVTIEQGTNGSSTVTVNDFGGFSGAVTLSASNVPTGVTVTFGTNPTSTSSSINITVSPSAATGTSSIAINGVSGAVTGQGGLQLVVSPAPLASFSPSSLTFGNEAVGQTSKAKTVTVTNTGKANLKFTSITASGDFAITNNSCTNQLGINGKCIVSVTFTPTQAGARTGSLTFSDNAPDSPQTVALSGNGTAAATLTPTSAKFPKTKVGTSSAAKKFTFANKESATLTGISASTTGNFSVSSNTCGSTLAAKSKCTIEVIFTPVGTGVQTGTLQVSSSAVGSPLTSSLSGTGK